MKIEEDELRIYEVEALHKELLNAFNQSEISIDMANVKKVDMSVIQLFVSMQKSCKKEDKSFKLLNVNEEVSTLFKSAACGFLLGANDE